MKLRAPRTTFGLVAVVSAILTALAILAALIGRNVAHEELEQQLNHRIAAESSLLLAEYRRGGLAALMHTVNDRHARQESSGLGYLLVRRDGHRLAGALLAEIPAKLGWQEFLYVDHGANGGQKAYQALTVALPSGECLVVAADRTPVTEIDGLIGWLTGGMSAAMLLLGLGGAWILGLITRRRIDNISSVASAIAGGEVGRRIPQNERAGEFERLAETLNRMLDRNAELLANLQQVSTDIAHDLLTPLSRHQQQLELALAEAGTVEDYRRAIGQAIGAAAEIQKLFSALLKISEIESLSLREDFNTVSLSEIAGRVGEAFRPDIEESGRMLRVELDQQANIIGEPQLLSQLLVNLVENAMVHTPKGTSIRIRLDCASDQAVLSVADDGPGIPPEQKSRITERFIRLESSRSTPGHGLGLSLVKAIVAMHGAALKIEDANPGLRVSATFRLG